MQCRRKGYRPPAVWSLGLHEEGRNRRMDADFGTIMAEAIRRAAQESNPKRQKMKRRVKRAVALITLVFAAALAAGAIACVVNAFNAADASNWPRAAFYTVWAIVDMLLLADISRD